MSAKVQGATISQQSAISFQQSRANRWVIWLLAGLMLYLAVERVLGLINIPIYIERVSSGTVDTLTIGGEPFSSQQDYDQAAAGRGMSLRAYAVYSTLVNLIVAIGFSAAGVLVLLNAGRDPFRWFTAFILFFFPGAYLSNFAEVGQIGYVFTTAGGILWPAFILFLFLFPNGRAVPRWAIWLIGPMMILHLFLQSTFFVAQFVPISESVFSTMEKLFPIVLGGLVVTVICQVYRYFWVSNTIEKLQTRWFVAGVASYIIIGLVINGFSGRVENSNFITDLTEQVLSLLIPFSITISILKYRLWDIDIIIRKTLVYGALTALLGLIFFGGVTVLQRVFQTISGQQSAVSIVISTLAIAALFNPLRRRIQNGIDRRFYRRKYNAEQSLAKFAEMARNETSIDKLSNEMLAVVQDTMQPERVSLWLKKGPAKR